MQESFPVSDSYKQILNFVPSRSQCLSKKDASTIKNLSDVIIYIRFINGNGFWYYLMNIDGDKVYGYKMRENLWDYTVLDTRKICSYY